MTFKNFWAAVEEGNIEAIDALANENPIEIVYWISRRNFQVFQNAAEKGHLPVMERLMELMPPQTRGAMISSNQFAAFGLAAAGGHLHVMEMLIELLTPQARASMIRANDFDAFGLAAAGGHLHVMEMLIELLSPHPQIRSAMISANHFAAFRNAAAGGHLDVLDRLIALAPESLEAMISANHFAAFRRAAAGGGHLDVIEKLIALAPESIEAMMSANEFDAFRMAAAGGHLDVIEKLIQSIPEDRMDAMISQNNLNNAFIRAASGGHLDVIERLIALSPPEKKEEMISADDFSAFQQAAQNGHLEVMDRLISLAPDNIQDMISADDYCAFQDAAFHGQVKVIEKLTKLVDPEALEEMLSENEFGAFSNAAEAKKGSLEIIERLIMLLPHKVEDMISAEDFLAFSRAAGVGNLDVMDRMMALVPESVQAMVSASEFQAFRWAAESLQYEDATERLLHFPLVFAYAEMHAHEYGVIVQSFRNRHLSALRQEIEAFQAENPDAQFDITHPEQARLYFYMMRNCIRLPSAQSMQQLEFLLSIPSVRALAHQEVTPNESNELLRLALSLNQREALDQLIHIPEVHQLAEQHDFYQEEQRHGFDLRALAQDRESSMRALTQGETKALERVKAKYQAQRDEQGVLNIMDDLRRCLETRYHDNPATVEADDGTIILLPFSYQEFQALPEDIQRSALKSYYQHPEHTAYRYLSKPNEWMNPNADFVHRNGNEAWSYFEDYQPLIALLYLAAKDESVESVNGWTIEGRIVNFISELACIGRAHNWDKTRVNPRTHSSEEYDDLEADKPSCYSGIMKRLFQSVLGHPLLTVLTTDIVSQAVHSVVHEHFISRINDDNYAELFKAWNAIIEGGRDDEGVLKQLNLTEEEQQQHIAAISAKLSELYEGQFDGFLRTYLNSLFNFANAFNSLAEKLGGETYLFSSLINKQKEKLHPIIFDVIRAHFEASIDNDNCVELQRAWRDRDESLLNQLNLSDEAKERQMELISKRFTEITGLPMHEDFKAYLDRYLSANLAQNYGQYLDLGAILATKVEKITQSAHSAEPSTVRRFFETSASAVYEAPRGQKRPRSGP